MTAHHSRGAGDLESQRAARRHAITEDEHVAPDPRQPSARGTGMRPTRFLLGPGLRVRRLAEDAATFRVTALHAARLVGEITADIVAVLLHLGADFCSMARNCAGIGPAATGAFPVGGLAVATGSTVARDNGVAAGRPFSEWPAPSARGRPCPAANRAIDESRLQQRLKGRAVLVPAVEGMLLGRARATQR